MILQSNAVIDPGAVVIESLNALVAGGAVAGARRADREALGTQLSAFNGFDHVHEVAFLRLL